MSQRRKTVEQRFEDWWKRATYMRRGAAVLLTVDQWKAYMRVGYFNGWKARTRTKAR